MIKTSSPSKKHSLKPRTPKDTNPRAIPEGYMRVGELAKKADVTVRTLQYYDKEGLLSPSAESEGGFRLYTEKDMAKLTQILMMKELGFPLSEIKKRLTSMDTPSDVARVLTEQATQVRNKIEVLSETLDAIEALKEEVTQMEKVDFKKYAAILVNLQIKNKNYWMVKHFNDDILDKLAESLDREKAEDIIKKANRLYDEAAVFQEQGVHPTSELGQNFAKEFWEMMLEVTGGDHELMQKMNDQAVKIFVTDETQRSNFMEMNRFIQPALMFYLNKLGEGPFGTANHAFYEAVRLQKEGVSPESEEAQRLAKVFWEEMLEITGGDTALVESVSAQMEENFLSGESQNKDFIEAKSFMETAIGFYLSNQGEANMVD